MQGSDFLPAPQNRRRNWPPVMFLRLCWIPSGARRMAWTFLESCFLPVISCRTVIATFGSPAQSGFTWCRHEHLPPSRKFCSIWSDRFKRLDLEIRRLLLEEEQYEVGPISCARN